MVGSRNRHPVRPPVVVEVAHQQLVLMVQLVLVAMVEMDRVQASWVHQTTTPVAVVLGVILGQDLVDSVAVVTQHQLEPQILVAVEVDQAQLVVPVVLVLS